MLKRYALPLMRNLWLDEQTKFDYWLKVELAVLEARMKLGDLSPAAYEAIKEHASFDGERIDALEAEYKHDMLAFIGSVQECLRENGAGQYENEFHKGMTSYDIEDPALILMMRRSAELILEELKNLERILRSRAMEHKWTFMAARTHGKFAEPSTFGHILLVYAEEVRRSIRRITHTLKNELSEGKISGAVGNYAGMNRRLEGVALKILGLKPARAETQILQRDRHAAFLCDLAIAAGTIEQMCRTFWEWMRSEVNELEEPRTRNQRGSSAMAHKKNPALTERLEGLSRLVRGCAYAGMENIATPEWRDISQSSVERHIIPDAIGIVHYMAVNVACLVENLVVFPDVMLRNLMQTSLGVWASQPVRLALMNAGVSYDAAYKYLQRASFEAQKKRFHLSDVLSEEPISEDDSRTAKMILGAERLMECFDPQKYVERGITHIFRTPRNAKRGIARE